MNQTTPQSETGPENPLKTVRRAIIDADTAALAQAGELIEPIERADFASRVDFMVDVARLAGVREGLAIARVVIDQLLESDSQH